MELRDSRRESKKKKKEERRREELRETMQKVRERREHRGSVVFIQLSRHSMSACFIKLQ